jgi:hypothetical protein
MFLIWINLIHANSAVLTGESEVQKKKNKQINMKAGGLAP